MPFLKRDLTPIEVDTIDVLKDVFSRKDLVNSSWTPWATAELLVDLARDNSHRYPKTTQDDRQHQILTAFAIKMPLQGKARERAWQVLLQLRYEAVFGDQRTQLALDWARNMDSWKSSYHREFKGCAIMVAKQHVLIAGMSYAGIATDYGLFAEALRDLTKDFYAHYDRHVQAASAWMHAGLENLEDAYCRASQHLPAEDVVEFWNAAGRKFMEIAQEPRVGEDAQDAAVEAAARMRFMGFDEDGCYWFKGLGDIAPRRVHASTCDKSREDSTEGDRWYNEKAYYDLANQLIPGSFGSASNERHGGYERG
ncbi:hypothetical protein JX265_000730 [Neoarthrinium moseri]|uniref:Uncharacterized protein n=1 Tax=Neoarthrinium moseri TaxID=1658444 RepID=A0A9P9WWI2_9PEZI|nr:uncharacterized protein JN550_013588 [Neoarthrinium moseri]KAI1856918.1 hypothetical protein JN550_013588 [Neoarthrinium moseri]KAI1880490.1 hypothetical protein JX265_000730 [Neoarthrinium moseri]